MGIVGKRPPSHTRSVASASSDTEDRPADEYVEFDQLFWRAVFAWVVFRVNTPAPEESSCRLT